MQLFSRLSKRGLPAVYIKVYLISLLYSVLQCSYDFLVGLILLIYYFTLSLYSIFFLRAAKPRIALSTLKQKAF
jgi:hypothetical protein